MTPKLRFLIAAALVITATASVLGATTGVPLLALSAPLLLPPALGALALARPRSVLDRGGAGGFLGAAGAGIVLFCAYRLLLQSGLGPAAAVPLLLLFTALPSFLATERFVGGALAYLPLVLVVEPGVGLILPHRFGEMGDPVSAILRSLAAGSVLALATGTASLAMGIPRRATAMGLFAGSGMGIWASSAGRLPAVAVLALALLAMGGGLELLSQVLGPTPPRRGRFMALGTATAVIAAVSLRTVFPAAQGLAPSSYESESLAIERIYTLSDSLVLSRTGERRQGMLLSSLGTFPMRSGDIDIFTGAALAVAYVPGGTSALLVGPHPSTEWLTLMQAGTFEVIEQSQPSPWPWHRLQLHPAPRRQSYDVVLVNVSGPEVEAVLPALSELLAPDGVLALRRFGPPWETRPAIEACTTSFPHALSFWDSERSGVSLLSRQPLRFDEAGAAFASQAVAARYAVLRTNGLVPTGAWLRPQPDGMPAKDTATSMDMALLHLASGDLHMANIALGQRRPDALPWVDAVRALVSRGLNDPTGFGAPGSLARAAASRDPENPFIAAVASQLAGVERPSHDAPPAIDFSLTGDAIPAWLVSGPFPLRRRLDRKELLLVPALDDDFLLPGMQEATAAPSEGDAIWVTIRERRPWRLAVAHGDGWSLDPAAIPFHVLGEAPDPSDCAYAYCEVALGSPATLHLASRRLAVAFVDGRAIRVHGRAEVPLAPGTHRLLLKAFAARGEVPHVRARLQPAAVADARVMVRARSTAFRLVDDHLAARVSPAVPRGMKGRLLLLDMPPAADAVASACLVAGGSHRRVDLADPDVVFPLADPGRHVVILTEREAQAGAVEIRLEVDGVVLSRKVPVPPAGRQEIYLVPTLFADGASHPDGLRRAMAAVRDTSEGLPREEQLRFTIASGAALESFLERASDRERRELSELVKAGRIEPPGVMLSVDRTLAPPQLLAYELERARRLGRALGGTPRTVVLGSGAGLPAGFGDFLAAWGIDLVLTPDGGHAASAGLPRMFLQGQRDVLVATQADPRDGSQLVSGSLSRALGHLQGLLEGLPPGEAPAVVIQAPGLEATASAVARLQAWNALFETPALRFATAAEFVEEARRGKRAWPRRDDSIAPRHASIATAPGPLRTALSSLPQLSVLAARVTESDSRDLGAVLEAGLDALQEISAPHRGGAPPPNIDGTLTDISRRASESLFAAVAPLLPQGSPRLLVLNPLPFARREPVSWTIGGEQRIAVLEAPALGWTTYPERADEAPECRDAAVEVDVHAGLLRNRYYEVRFDPVTGGLVRILDRELGVVIHEAGSLAGAGFAVGTGSAPDGVRLATTRLLEVEGRPDMASVHVGVSDPELHVEGRLVLTLYADVKRIDAWLGIDAAATPSGRIHVVLPVPFPAALEREGPLLMEPLTATHAVATRGGIRAVIPAAVVALACPDTPYVLPGPPRVVTGASSAAAGMRFALTSASRTGGFSTHAFFRSVETPLLARVVDPPAESGRLSATQRSYIQAQPDTLEIMARPDVILEGVPRPPNHLEVLVRNGSADSRQQKLIFPVEGNYLQFPLAPHEVLGLDIDLARP